MPHRSPLPILLLILFCLPAVLRAGERSVPDMSPVSTPTVGCLACHPAMEADEQHAFSCTFCHGGHADEQQDRELAHQGLIAQPAHPEHMQQTCGRCHGQQVELARHSSHFTLANKINAIRAHFGATDTLQNPAEIPRAASADAINSGLALVDDMLRRRCLRCHVYSRGDNYSAVRHGSGCAACHLHFSKGKAADHRFRLPTEQQCLSCHYGNYVGSDYLGRYEQDLPAEYRTPYTTGTADNLPPRPYGVEYHQLAADVHHERGMGCRDCHQGFVHKKATAGTAAPRCLDCHGWTPAEPLPALDNLSVHGEQLILTGVQSGNRHLVPQLQHPAHQEYGTRVDCQVCHAQWSYNDSSTHLLLSYSTDFDPWIWLGVQGSSEVEQRVEDGIFGHEGQDPRMRDGLNGLEQPGIWYKGFTERRWERMLIGRDAEGRLRVLRPILDLRLSMLDDKDVLRFDNLRGRDAGHVPYTPHTTGPAGLFYRDRLKATSPP